MFLNVYFVSASGWASALLVAITTSLPYLLRRRAVTPQTQWLGPFLVRLRPHYWLGYLIVGLSLLHAGLSMSRELMNGTNSLGLTLATGALFLLFWQVTLGLSLSQRTTHRRQQRRWHFAVMLGIAALGSGHIVLNSVLLRVLVH